MQFLTSFSDSTYTASALPLFQNVEDDALFSLLAECAVCRLEENETFQVAGNGKSSLYVVLKGHLRVSSGEKTAADDAAFTSIIAGECVGELCVLDEHARSPEILALEESDVLAIDAVKMWKMINEFNGVARNMLHLLSFRIQTANAQLRQRQKVGRFYRELSMLDGLTGLHNRAWLDEHLPEIVSNSHARRLPATVIMFDLDYFKQFNDTHGHLVGDDGLRTASRVMDEALRPTDFSVRYGGEEFFVILPDTEYHIGLVVAERLRERMARAVVFEDMKQPLPHITASFGVAQLREGQDANALIAVADQALYSAKRAGRNCVFGGS